MIKLRVRKRKPKTLTLGTAIFFDDGVSLQSRGLLCTILALAQDDDEFTIEDLALAVPATKTEIYNSIDELRKYGYCTKVKSEFGDLEYVFQTLPKASRKASRGKNKSPLIYSKSMAQVQEGIKQSRERGAGEIDPEFEDWETVPSKLTTGHAEQDLLPPRRTKKLSPISHTAHKIMQQICYLVETEQEALMLSSKDRGRIANSLDKLRKAGMDISKLHHFEEWWRDNWRSRDKVSKQYQPPRPEQVVEFWLVAMKSFEPKTVVKHEVPASPVIDVVTAMRNRAEQRRKQ